MPFCRPVQLSLCNGRSPGISSMLLRLCWETQQTFFWPILEKLVYLCNLIWLQAPPHATSCDKDTSRTQNERRIRRKDKEKAILCGHRMQNHSLFVGCLAFASPMHLSKSLVLCEWTDWYPWSLTDLVLYFERFFCVLLSPPQTKHVWCKLFQGYSRTVSSTYMVTTAGMSSP